MAQIKVNVATATTGELATANIANSAVTTAKIAADAVTDAKVADDVIGTEHLTAGEVDATALGADSVTAAKIGDNVINSEHYAAASVDNEHIGTDIAASKIASGTFADARISASSVTQHVDLTSVRNDVAALALYSAVADNKTAHNLPNSFIEQFQDDTGIQTETTVDRQSAEYVDTETTIVDTDTKLLIHSDTSNLSTTFTDSSASARTITANGDVKHSTAQQKFGATSIYFDTDDDFISCTGAGSDTTGDFTLDYWMWTDATAGCAILDFRSGAGGNFYMDQVSATQFNYVINSNTVVFNPATDVASSSWNHIAVVRDSSDTFYAFFNGVAQVKESGSGTLTSNLAYNINSGSVPLLFGENYPSTAGYEGYLDEIRLSHTARWTSNFTPPTSPYTNLVTTISATGTLISNASVASAAQTKVSGVMLYKDNDGTATIGTDLKIYFSCDNGSNWTEAASYGTVSPVFSTGVKMIRLGETTCTSGTQVLYKAVWANQSSGSKETQLHGIGMNY